MYTKSALNFEKGAVHPPPTKPYDPKYLVRALQVPSGTLATPARHHGWARRRRLGEVQIFAVSPDQVFVGPPAARQGIGRQGWPDREREEKKREKNRLPIFFFLPRCTYLSYYGILCTASTAVWPPQVYRPEQSRSCEKRSSQQTEGKNSSSKEKYIVYGWPFRFSPPPRLGIVRILVQRKKEVSLWFPIIAKT